MPVGERTSDLHVAGHDHAAEAAPEPVVDDQVPVVKEDVRSRLPDVPLDDELRLPPRVGRALRPRERGAADLVIYSATKFIGGHSDLVAGVVTGPKRLMDRVLEMRTVLGTMTTPFNGWLLLRSLETLSVRMRRQAKSAKKLAELLAAHPRVTQVLYPGLLEPGQAQHDLWKRQCSGAGSLVTFEVDGGEKQAYEVLDRFEVIRLAVSLGGTESLVEHPMSMTHADVPRSELEALGVTAGMIRMSVGLEHLSDLTRDLKHALG
jgi:methionine-gamma-lyase